MGRLSLNPNSNIIDFWPPIVDKFGRFGDPEDYEIWCDQKPLEGPLIHGLAYEIVPRVSPGHFKPAERRNSIDYGVEAKTREPKALEYSGTGDPKWLVRSRARDWSPQPLLRTRDPVREVPPQWSAQIVYQAYDAPDKEWRGWFTEEDTEYAIERRARTSLGIIGTWRRLPYWRDISGIRMVMTNRQKEIKMRYSGGIDHEIKEMQIPESDTCPIPIYDARNTQGPPTGMKQTTVYNM
jgi:hypothetical protein